VPRDVFENGELACVDAVRAHISGGLERDLSERAGETVEF
jgi:hypothetical protein